MIVSQTRVEKLKSILLGDGSFDQHGATVNAAKKFLAAVEATTNYAVWRSAAMQLMTDLDVECLVLCDGEQAALFNEAMARRDKADARGLLLSICPAREGFTEWPEEEPVTQ
jgi:hypothetical protein